MTVEGAFQGVIEIGADGQPIQPILVLSNRGGRKIGVIQNVQELERTHPMNSPSELSFDVYKYTEVGKCEYWDDIVDFKFVTIPYDNSWYEATVSVDEENDTVKHVTCTHANEAELGQVMLFETEINTEADIARDDYQETVFYNEANPQASLLDRILADKAPHYQIYQVDETLCNLFRQFSFNGTSIYDALMQIAEEVGCLFVFGEWNENDGQYHRTISAYDLQDYCNTCHKRGDFSSGECSYCHSTNIKDGYGEDSGIYVSVENLAENINYSGDPDSVKNCFRLVAGDDVMTAAVKTCNPAMSQYIWYFSDEMKSDMSTALRNRLAEYDTAFDYYRDEKDMEEIVLSQRFPLSIQEYNNLVTIYSEYNESLVPIPSHLYGTIALTNAYYNAINMYGYLKTSMCPVGEETRTTTAEAQMNKLTRGSRMRRVGVASLTGLTISAANSAIQSFAKVYIDTSRYNVVVNGTSYNSPTWIGYITLTSFTDEDDTATEAFTITMFDGINDYSTWLEQKVKKAMANKKANNVDPVALFDTDVTLAQFREALKLYSADNLDMIYAMAEAAITVLTEQGVSKKESGEETPYQQIYLPYWRKMKAVIVEQSNRAEQLNYLQRPTDEFGNYLPNTVHGLINYCKACQNSIRKTLDLENFLGENLWEELSFYRREQEYNNPNYISDGLTDAEIIGMANQFFDVAQKEIVKSATLQHTISADLYDLFLIPEFHRYKNMFLSGNWIHLRVDDKLFKLRLTNWTENYGSIEKIDVEFSDAIRTSNTIDDVNSILSQSKSMATTYSYTTHQADKGSRASTVVQTYKDKGISFGDVKAIVSKGRTNIKYDDEGILLRRTEDDGVTFADEQARIYNNGIYITKDAWESVSTGLGHYSYIDPDTGNRVTTYGIIADTVLGRLILGENLKIYGENGKYEMGGNGVIITAKEDGENENLFTVQKLTQDEHGRDIYEKYIYVNADGEVVIAGNSVRIQNQPLVEYIDDKIEEDIGEITQPVTVVLSSTAGTVFKNGNIATTLIATVYRGSTDITNTVTRFTWTKKNKDGELTPWQRITNVNFITITGSDVTEKAIFGCEATVPEPNNG